MQDLRVRIANIALDNSDARSTEDLLNSWHSSVITILDHVAPMKNYPVCKKKCKWMTDSIRRLIQQRNKMARLNLINPFHETFLQYKKYKSIVRSRLRRESINYGTMALADTSDRSGVWKFIRETTYIHKKGTNINGP